jgi:hypothetical protein
MIFKNTESCAVQEISKLRLHKTPEDAMEAFCKSELQRPSTFKGFPLAARSMYSFYIFTAGVEIPGVRGQEWVAEMGFVPLGGYGPAFARFIVDNELGTVVESPVIVNKAFHKDHANQVWIWAPDRAKLEIWWADRQNKKEKVA